MLSTSVVRVPAFPASAPVVDPADPDVGAAEAVDAVPTADSSPPEAEDSARAFGEAGGCWD
ncbi:hypothetical protein, partial [Streptomyces sp. NRRL F-3273]|uniref:hypothetical protein n=1 Tax=Streptomyces sp. NRRL F-3273 TaxID=1463848 RepID=UPI0005160515